MVDVGTACHGSAMVLGVCLFVAETVAGENRASCARVDSRGRLSLHKDPHVNP